MRFQANVIDLMGTDLGLLANQPENCLRTALKQNP